MFKKKLTMLIAAALMTLSTSSAFAAFADSELIRVYYDRNGAEIATDLGKVTDLTAAGASNTIADRSVSDNVRARIVTLLSRLCFTDVDVRDLPADRFSKLLQRRQNCIHKGLVRATAT